MPTLVYHTGFEWEGVSTLSAQGGGLCNAIYGTAPTIVTDFVRTGSRAMRFAPASSTNSGFSLVSSTPQIHVFSFGLYYVTLPSGAGSDPRAITCQAEQSGTAWVGLAVDPSDGSYRGFLYRAGFNWLNTGPVLTTGRYYQIDCLLKTNGTTWSVDYKVDGVPYAGSLGGQSAQNTIPQIDAFCSAANPPDLRVDDLVYSQTEADYPLGKYGVIRVVPEGAASHQSITLTEWDTTTDFSAFSDFTASDESTSAALLDDLNTTDGIRCAGTAGNPRWNLSNPTHLSGKIDAVRSLITVREASAGTNNATIRIRASGGTTSNIFSGNPGWGTTWNYLGLMSTSVPGGSGWSTTDVEGLTLEADSTDAAPAWWMGGYTAEVAYKIGSLIWQPRALPTIYQL